MVFLEDSNILGESQGAFRRDRRREDHLFKLNGICSLRKAQIFSEHFPKTFTVIF
jgi:hypothetical protein